MICVSIQHKNCEEILEILAKVEMAEIRLDLCDLSLDEIEEIFSTDTPTVATCRVEPTNYRSVDEAQRKLSAAIKSGAAFVDVEIEAPKSLANAIKNLAREYGTRLIRSYHDYEGTDSLEALKAMVGKCLYHGAELVKIVTTAKQESDGLRVLSLYDSKIWAGEDKAPGQGDLIAFCMGEVGRQTRLDCLKFGAPYTYAALSQEEATASGQWTYTDMCQALYGGAANKAMDCAETSCKAAGSTEDSGEAMDCAEIVGQADIDIPCSKSFAQRAIITAALAQGTSSLDGYTPCSDNEAAIAVAQALGAKITRIADRRNASGSTETGGSTGHMTLQIEGIGAQKGSLPMEYLHTGESGLLTRLMIPLCAMLSPTQVRIEGEKTLLKRPLAGVKDMMDALGAQVENLTEGKEKEEAQVPLCVSGPLNGGRVDISGRQGSQLISGLLMALPLGDKNTTLSVQDPKSIPYMFITLDVLKHFGVKIGNELLGGRDFIMSDGDWNLCTGILFKIKGGQGYKACNMSLEGDWSAAANFLVAGAIFGNKASKNWGKAAPLLLRGLDTTSLQADLSIMDVLMDCGACLSQVDGDKGDIIVQRAPLRAFRIDAGNCPDLFPILSILAAFCAGESRIGGVGRLAHKESDRGKAIVEMLTQMGVKVSIDADEMVICGKSLSQRLLSGELLKGGNYTSQDDHRMVMALKVASLGADSPIVIDNEKCVEKSFPGFNHSFEQYLN